MSWFNASGFASLAKTALDQAQKTIDKALDIKDERGKSSTNTTVNKPDVTKPESNSNVDAKVAVVADDRDSFFAEFGVSEAVAAQDSRPQAEEQQPSTSVWGSFTGSFFDTGASSAERKKAPPEERTIATQPKKAKSTGTFDPSRDSVPRRQRSVSAEDRTVPPPPPPPPPAVNIQGQGETSGRLRQRFDTCPGDVELFRGDDGERSVRRPVTSEPRSVDSSLTTEHGNDHVVDVEPKASVSDMAGSAGSALSLSEKDCHSSSTLTPDVFSDSGESFVPVIMSGSWGEERCAEALSEEEQGTDCAKAMETAMSTASTRTMLEEAMVESGTRSPHSTASSSEPTKVESEENSGHTSGDEAETVSSSDIEIISPNGEPWCTGDRNNSPACVSLSPVKQRQGPRTSGNQPTFTDSPSSGSPPRCGPNSPKGWESLRCSAHTLQLCIQAGLNVAPVEQTLVVARKLVEHFKSNPQAMSELNKWQQQMQVPEHDLLQDLRGRWITTFLMIQRLLEQRWPAAAVVSDCQVTKSKTNLNLRADQWELLAEVVAALEPVQVATAFLGAEYNISVSVLFPVLFGILRAMEPKQEDSATIKHVKGLVSSEVKSRWGLDRVDGSNPTVPLLAAALDPRFKSLKFLDEEKRMQMQCSLYKIAERQALSTPPSAEDQQSGGGDSALGDKSASALDLLLGEDPPQVHVHVPATNSSPWYTPVQNKCQDEIQRFVMDTPAPREMNPLHWWAANENRFPILGRVARSYFSIPATAAPAERVFDPSVTGVAVDLDRRRSALAPADVDTVVFLHRWHHRNASEMSVSSEESDGSQATMDALLKKLGEMSRTLDAREAKVLELSKENAKLRDGVAILESQMKRREEAHSSEALDVTNLTKEFTERMSRKEKEIQTALKEKENLQKELRLAKEEIVIRVSKSHVDELLKEKELQAAELMQEGEKLSKQLLQQSNIIKKLRNKEKESDTLLAQQKVKLQELSDDADRAAKALAAKEEIEKRQIEAVSQLMGAMQKLELEMAAASIRCNAAEEKARQAQSALEDARKEMAKWKSASVEASTLAQEAKLSAEMTAKEELRCIVDQIRNDARLEQEGLIFQLEQLRNAASAIEDTAGSREESLRQHVAGLQTRLQEVEARNEELTLGVASATRPLLRQIDNLQAALKSQVAQSERTEKNLNDKLSDAVRQLGAVTERERTVTSKYAEVSSKLASLQSENQMLLQEKLGAQVKLETESTKISQMEESSLKCSALVQELRRSFAEETERLRREKETLEHHLEIEKVALETERRRRVFLQEQLSDKDERFQRLDSKEGRRDSDSSFRRTQSTEEDPTTNSNHQVQEPFGAANYEGLRTAGGVSTVLENLQAQLKQREGEITVLQSELAQLGRVRESMTREMVLVNSTNEALAVELDEHRTLLDNYRRMEGEYNALLQMYGEKVEQIDELQLDLQDVKEMYKAQIDELTKRPC